MIKFLNGQTKLKVVFKVTDDDIVSLQSLIIGLQSSWEGTNDGQRKSCWEHQDSKTDFQRFIDYCFQIKSVDDGRFPLNSLSIGFERTGDTDHLFETWLSNFSFSGHRRLTTPIFGFFLLHGVIRTSKASFRNVQPLFWLHHSWKMDLVSFEPAKFFLWQAIQFTNFDHFLWNLNPQKTFREFFLDIDDFKDFTLKIWSYQVVEFVGQSEGFDILEFDLL